MRLQQVEIRGKAFLEWTLLGGGMLNGSCELQFFDVVAATNLELFSIRVVKWHTIRTARP